MAKNGNILVFVDLPDGCLDETGKGLLSYATRLAGVVGSPWEVVVPVAPGEEARAGFAAFGTPVVTVLEGGGALLDAPAHLATALAACAADGKATLLLLPHNDLGATLAPILAAALKAGLLTETVSLRRNDGELELSRQALGARISETRIWDGSRPLVLTVPTRALSQVLMATVRPSTPAYESYCPAAPQGATALVAGRIPPDPQTVDLTDAEVIFSAGKGCDPTTFAQLQELCLLLNVSCGVTRPVYDLGWTGFERMVGQTGRTVTPKFYLALGISGSMHHVGGMKDSRRIVAVNSDSKAPIFPNCNEGFVADLKDVLPRLIERAKTARGGAA
jgi:electron transfer flavoprotein alpha subunit